MYLFVSVNFNWMWPCLTNLQTICVFEWLFSRAVYFEWIFVCVFFGFFLVFFFSRALYLYMKKNIIEKIFALVVLKYFNSTEITKKTRYNFLQSTFKLKIIHYTNIEAKGWLLEMISPLEACVFKLYEIFVFSNQIFLCPMSSKEIVAFISFYDKLWRYDDVTTALTKSDNSNYILHISEMPK